MKLRMISGLMALQMAAAITASAQNYYIKIGGDKETFIADHASWEQGWSNFDESLESYNLTLPSGLNAVGMMRFYSPGGTLGFASHYQLSGGSEQVIARRILSPAFNNGLFVVGEKIASGGGVKSVAVLHYDLSSGSLLDARELPSLPSGYSFLHVYDVIGDADDPDSQNKMRILITATVGSTEVILELLYNANTNQYTVKHYKPQTQPDHYRSVYYVRAYHYGEFNLGEISFYGMADYKDNTLGYCYWNGKYQIYDLYASSGKQNVTGIQMNGSYGNDGSHNRIDMAFIDMDNDICIQQKDEMGTPNWRRFYHLPEGKLRMGWGRDGHGTKQGGGMDYFIATANTPNINDPEGHVTTLHYDALNGNMMKPNIYNFSGIGVNKGGGFPNTTYDPVNNYTFIADRFKQEHGFKFGTGNPTSSEIKCTELYPVKEIKNKLKEIPEEMYIGTFDIYDAHELGMEKVDISVDIVKECKEEQRGAAPQELNTLLTASSSTVQMNNDRVRIDANGKTITSLRVFAIDGRLVSDVNNINSTSYEQQFKTALVPGVYMLKISYNDKSSEVRKVSVQ